MYCKTHTHNMTDINIITQENYNAFIDRAMEYHRENRFDADTNYNFYSKIFFLEKIMNNNFEYKFAAKQSKYIRKNIDDIIFSTKVLLNQEFIKKGNQSPDMCKQIISCLRDLTTHLQ